MSSLVAFALVSFGSLFSIVDPFAALPVFLALAGGEPKEVQRNIALRAAMTCAAVLTVFAIAGAIIMKFFGITISGFKIAGGIILFGVAFEMMHARESSTRSTREETVEAETKADVALVPLGLPLLSGPGAIAAVMVLMGKAETVPKKIVVHVAVIVVSALAFLVLRSGAHVSKVLGQTGIKLIGRVMGLLLAAVAAQFIIDGLIEAFPRALGP